jgi:Zn-dependent peptidase ImmA (M78 family)
MRNIQRALREARRILQEEKIRKAPVAIYRLAKKYADVVEIQMDDEISGMLIPPTSKLGETRWTIVVNQAHSTVRKRFTVAHELGHLRLHGFTSPHADRGFKVRFRSERASDGSIAEEIEANQFAAEILMPAHLLLARLSELEVEYAPDIQDEDSIAKLAEEFRVSQQALSIRLSNLLV